MLRTVMAVSPLMIRMMEKMCRLWQTNSLTWEEREKKAEYYYIAKQKELDNKDIQRNKMRYTS